MRTLKIKTLPSVKEQSWCDRDYILFHSCFQLLVDWVEKEEGIQNWSFQSDMTSINKLKELYDWWQANSETIDCVGDVAQENLEQLVKLRRFLWT